MKGAQHVRDKSTGARREATARIWQWLHTFTGAGEALSPPQDLEAERWLLGGILLDNEVLHEIAQFLTADDFYRDAHQIIYRAISELCGAGKGVDAVTLADELTRRDQFRQIGGDEMLLEIVNSVPHAANARYHAELVRQKSISRQLIQSTPRSSAKVTPTSSPRSSFWNRQNRRSCHRLILSGSLTASAVEEERKQVPRNLGTKLLLCESIVDILSTWSINGTNIESI